MLRKGRKERRAKYTKNGFWGYPKDSGSLCVLRASFAFFA